MLNARLPLNCFLLHGVCVGSFVCLLILCFIFSMKRQFRNKRYQEFLVKFDDYSQLGATRLLRGIIFNYAFERHILYVEFKILDCHLKKAYTGQNRII